MLWSKLFIPTLRETPAEVQSPGYGYLLRAGYFRQVAAGIFAALPLGLRVQRPLRVHPGVDAEQVRRGHQHV